MGDSSDERRFNEREVALVLRRAAQLQAASDSDGGATLAELEQMALEAGIDPRYVRHAAQHVAIEKVSRPSRFVGGATRLLFERTLEGQLPPSAFEALAAELREGLPQGQASLIGRTLTWTSFIGGARGASARTVTVTITAGDEMVTLRVEENLRQLAGSLFGGLMGGLGGGLGAMGIPIGIGLGSVLATVGIWAGCLAGAYGIARLAYGRTTRRREQQLRAVFDRLCACAESAIAAARTKTLPPATTP